MTVDQQVDQEIKDQRARVLGAGRVVAEIIAEIIGDDADSPASTVSAAQKALALGLGVTRRLCVGGPWHGQVRTVSPALVSVLAPTPATTSIEYRSGGGPGILHTIEAGEPYRYVPSLWAFAPVGRRWVVPILAVRPGTQLDPLDVIEAMMVAAGLP